ncbi:MAG TPA: prolyl oligopeptidase family serine peptidase [Lacunisphaera sp.]|nr:prolyl oligopeptidase family serine peptidase [Lacunisphaera sp.]
MFAASLASAQSELPPLLAARKGFQTKLLRQDRINEAAVAPPAGVLSLVKYPAPLGANAAYVSPDPKDGKKHAIILWLVGGFSNSIGDIAWTPGPPQNDQSASAIREAGILMMYPSLRGGNDNPGVIENCYGEVDDVLAAAKFAAALPYVDASRIYLGGHSTGGTLALLAAAAGGDRFRAVFSLGPVDDVTAYGDDALAFDTTVTKEGQLRAPKHWLKDIKCPTFVYEGTKQPSNYSSLLALQKRNTNPGVTFTPVPGESHFSVIAPTIGKIIRYIEDDAQKK